MEENKIKHLEMIQNIITRMNTNSFQIKELTITIVAALLAVYASTSKLDLILIAIIPSILFWHLDTYYLNQERKFRALYNDVAGVSKNPKDIKVFEMCSDLYKGGRYSYSSAMFSRTICPLYVSIIIILLTIFFYIKHS